MQKNSFMFYYLQVPLQGEEDPTTLWVEKLLHPRYHLGLTIKGESLSFAAAEVRGTATVQQMGDAVLGKLRLGGGLMIEGPVPALCMVCVVDLDWRTTQWVSRIPTLATMEAELCPLYAASLAVLRPEYKHAFGANFWWLPDQAEATNNEPARVVAIRGGEVVQVPDWARMMRVVESRL